MDIEEYLPPYNANPVPQARVITRYSPIGRTYVANTYIEFDFQVAPSFLVKLRWTTNITGQYVFTSATYN